MANPTVDKLKALGLRHGEKAVVALAALLCVVFCAQAFTHETIKLTPDEIKQATQQAQSNIQRTPSQDDIKNLLEQEKIEEPHFLALVDARKPGAATAEPYRLVNDLTSPEPGAGLLRGTPGLIAPRRLFAHAGRGMTVVYATDKEGNRKYVDPATLKPEQRPKKKKKSSRPMGMMGSGMGRMGSSGSSPKKKSGALEKKKQKEEEEHRAELLKKSLAGEDMPKDAEPEDESAEDENGVPVEESRGIRWVSVVGELDQKALIDNYTRALKVASDAAHPHYLRLDLQRQERLPDGNWPGDDEWQDVDRKENELVLNNIKEQEEELVPEEHRLEGLVDLLPFLRSGYWRNVHLKALVPDKIKNPPKKKDAKGAGADSGYMTMMGSGSGAGMDSAMMAGGSGSGSGMMSSSSGGMGSGMQGMSTAGGGMMMSSGSGGGMMMSSGSGGGMMMGSGSMFGGGSGGPGGPVDSNYPTSKADTLMVRSLDFTVEPESVYRYRVRLVVRNPNYHWEMVLPGVDTDTEEMPGPWSEPTAPVSVPGDVSAYALTESPGSFPPGGKQVQFRVVRWTPDDGMTVYRQFDEGPGDIIGEGGVGVQVPSEDGKKKVSKTVDFTSHQIVLDTMGGSRPLDRFDLGVRLEAPVMALVCRYDGALVLRDQARDVSNGEMEEFKDIYEDTMKEVEKGTKKSRSTNMMMGSSSGGMMSSGGR